MADPCRIARVADAAEVGDLLHRFNTEFGDFSPGAQVIARRVAEHVERDLSVFLLARPAYAGVAQLRFRDSLFVEGQTCYLEELYVVPAQRRRRHGLELMKTAMRIARERGAETMELATGLDDRAARVLYERLGFSNLEKEGQPGTQMLFYERRL